MINVFTQELLDIKQELLKLKTASAKSAVGLGSLASHITVTTQTTDSDNYSGRSYILVQGDEPFIVQGYFDDGPNFQNDHISFIEALFFPDSGVSLLVVRAINLNHSVHNPSFTDKMTIVTTSPVVVSVQ